MGKGYNNYMTKKFFHPSSKDNIKRVWMAQMKTEYEKKKQEDMLAQYQKEQDMYGNRALLGDQKAKVGLSFMYDPPPGLKTKEKEDDEPEYKFEWQRKYNAPREAYAKDDETIRDQPFGIEVRNVRCIKCRQWGHVNTDKICPLFGKNLTAEPLQFAPTRQALVEGMKEDGFQMKQILLGNIAETAAASQGMVDGADEDDPEVQFLRSLTPDQKKKLLKKLNKLKKKQKDKKKKSKHKSKNKERDSDKRHSKSSKKKRSDSSSEDDSDKDSSPIRNKSRSKGVKTSRKRRHSSTSSSSSSDSVLSPSKSKRSHTSDSGSRKMKHKDFKQEFSHDERDIQGKKPSDKHRYSYENDDKERRHRKNDFPPNERRRERDHKEEHSKYDEARYGRVRESEKSEQRRKRNEDSDRSHRHEYKEKHRDRYN
ncbi:hypothetical protein ScPMuIL_015111 [Solemya velum]